MESIVEMSGLVAVYTAVVRHLSKHTDRIINTHLYNNLKCTDKVKAEFISMWKIVNEFPDKFETFGGAVPEYQFINQGSRRETFAAWKKAVGDARIAFMITGKNFFDCLIDETKSIEETKEAMSNFKSKSHHTEQDIWAFFNTCIADIIAAANMAAQFNGFVTPARVQMLQNAFFDDDVIVNVANQIAELSAIADSRVFEYRNAAFDCLRRKSSAISGASRAIINGEIQQKNIVAMTKIYVDLQSAASQPNATPDIIMKCENAKIVLEHEKNKTFMKTAQSAQYRIDEAAVKSESASKSLEKLTDVANIYKIDKAATKLVADATIMRRAAASMCEIGLNSTGLATQIAAEIGRLGLMSDITITSSGRTLSVLAAASVALMSIETTTNTTITVKRTANEADLDELAGMPAKK